MRYPRYLIIIILFIGITLVGVHRAHSVPYNSKKINEIKIRFKGEKGRINIENLRPLIELSPGEIINHKKIRSSLQNLYNVGYFSDIETRIKIRPDDSVDLIFQLENRDKIKKIKLNYVPGISSSGLRRAILSIRENVFLDKKNVEKALVEIKRFLSSRGYFNSVVKYRIKTNRLNAEVIFKIKKGEAVRLNRVYIKGDDKGTIDREDDIFKMDNYTPFIFMEKIKEVEATLKDMGYFFPHIKQKEIFLNKYKTLANVYLEIDPGFKYTIRIDGIKKKFGFVTDIWKKKVFENWAERESRARIKVYLRNKGYLNAEVDSEIKTDKGLKTIIFKIKKNDRFVLGKIEFEGNKLISTEELINIISIDDLIFEKIFHLRINSIKVDAEVLKWFYYYKGFPYVKIQTGLKFKNRTADLKYIIEEGERFFVDSILFRGNRLVKAEVLNSLMKTRPTEPFVERKLNEDLDKLRKYYYLKGFDNIEVDSEVSSGRDKSILININEGRHLKFGKLVIIGASHDQTYLLKKRFPLKEGDDFNRMKVEVFRNEIDRSSIFSEIRIRKIENGENLNVILITEQNKSRYLGFGIGYEERTGLRFTFEYQQKNFLNTYSTFSGLVQLGLNERRGEISYETPYILGTKMNSSLKIWEENELYRSYKFNRYGISESLVRKLSPDSYVLSSLSWYSTKLLELNVSSDGIDFIDVPYDITALNFSYVIDKRDDPFLPTKGTFFSTDVKIALPVMNSDFSFIRFRWGYQKNLKFLRKGILSLSVRNGFATDNIPITERFFGGGSSTFRGTRNDKLGSLDKETGEPYGGNSLLLLNFEATFPLYIVPVEDLYYSVFADFGNIYRYADEFSMENLQKAIGVGLRLKSSIGLLSFDIAYNIERRESVSPVAFHIGIGNVF
ncbi:MAG: BamA/TamA family outer membrane protein [Acidobacteriota bacterium]